MCNVKVTHYCTLFKAKYGIKFAGNNLGNEDDINHIDKPRLFVNF